MSTRLPTRLSLAAFLSLAIGVGASVLWYGSLQGRVREFSIRPRENRYTVRSETGRLALFAPPRPWPVAEVLEAEIWVRTLRNDALYWEVPVLWRDDTLKVIATSARLKPDSSWPPELTQLTGAQLVRPLLRAMEDPARFAAAHFVINMKYRSAWSLGRADRASVTQDEKAMRYNQDGLALELQPSVHRLAREQRPQGEKRRRVQFVDLVCDASHVKIDPGQMPEIRQLWHRRLDVEVAGVPYAAVVPASLLLPGFCGARRWRERTRAARGLCPACGYDLRHTPDRCPECGRRAGGGAVEQRGYHAPEPAGGNDNG